MKDFIDSAASGLLQFMLLIIGVSFFTFSFLLMRDGNKEGLSCAFYGIMCFSMQEIISVIRKKNKL